MKINDLHIATDRTANMPLEFARPRPIRRPV